ncbi:hypothetical protein P8452_52312 [Trifolium repens]|nr:hypothetical protein P8452_52312 [Trifolium repens]
MITFRFQTLSHTLFKFQIRVRHREVILFEIKSNNLEDFAFSGTIYFQGPKLVCWLYDHVGTASSLVSSHHSLDISSAFWFYKTCLQREMQLTAVMLVVDNELTRLPKLVDLGEE